MHFQLCTLPYESHQKGFGLSSLKVYVMSELIFTVWIQLFVVN